MINLHKALGSKGNLEKKTQANFIKTENKGKMKGVHYLSLLLVSLLFASSVFLGLYKQNAAAVAEKVVAEKDEALQTLTRQVTKLRSERQKYAVYDDSFLDGSRFDNLAGVEKLIAFLDGNFNVNDILSIQLTGNFLDIRVKDMSLKTATELALKLKADGVVRNAEVNETGTDFSGNEFASLSVELEE